MADTLPLDFVPSSPSGPSGGRLQIEAGRVAVVRKGVFGTKAALARSRNDLRGYERGTAADLSARSWMSAGAQLALQRAATVDPNAPFLAIRFDDPVGLGDVWLFTGPTDQMDLAIAALSSGGVISSAGTQVVSGSGQGQPEMHGDDTPMQAEVDRIREALAGRRRSSPVAKLIGLFVTLAMLGVGAYVAFRVVPDFIDEVRTNFQVPNFPPPELPTIPNLPPGNPPDPQDEARPVSVRQALRGLASPSVEQAGVTQAGRQRRSGRAVIIPLRYRNRPLQLIVFPDPQVARASKRASDQLLVNLILRGQGAARVAPVVFVAVVNPQTPVI